MIEENIFSKSYAYRTKSQKHESCQLINIGNKFTKDMGRKPTIFSRGSMSVQSKKYLKKNDDL